MSAWAWLGATLIWAFGAAAVVIALIRFCALLAGAEMTQGVAAVANVFGAVVGLIAGVIALRLLALTGEGGKR